MTNVVIHAYRLVDKSANVVGNWSIVQDECDAVNVGIDVDSKHYHYSDYEAYHLESWLKTRGLYPRVQVEHIIREVILPE